MIASVYVALKAIETQPIEAWEALRGQFTEAAELRDFDIALKARQIMEAAKPADPQ